MSKTIAEIEQCATLVEIVQHRILSQQDQTVYTFLTDGETTEVNMTYGELDKKARAIGAWLQSAGGHGERVLLLYPPGLDYIAAFFGCLYSGAIAVPAYPPDPSRLNKTMPRLQAIVDDAQAKFVLTTTEILSFFKKFEVVKSLPRLPIFSKVTNVIGSRLGLQKVSDLNNLNWLATDSLDISFAENWQQPDIDGDSIAFLQYTSGSTGNPKGVMLTHGNILHNQTMVEEKFEHSEKLVVVGWLPLYHDMGLIGHILQPMYVGGCQVNMSPLHFLQKPLRWLQAITKYGGTTSCGPNFAFDLCVRKVTEEQKADLDLSSWDVAGNGAEPIRPETIIKFSDYFASCGFRKEAFYPCYGLAEATLFVAGGKKSDVPIIRTFDQQALNEKRVVPVAEEQKDENSQTLVSCGESISEQKLYIVNTDTLTICPEGTMGEIWIASESVSQGYWRKIEETRTTFQAYTADTKEGPFLRTGDLGFLQDGQLFIAGRLKDLIIIAGSNHYPQDIEKTIEESHTRIRPGCAAAFAYPVEGEDKLVVAAEIRNRFGDRARSFFFWRRYVSNIDEITKAMRNRVTTQHQLQIHTILLLKARSIPKTSSGKIQRRACQAGFTGNDLDVIYCESKRKVAAYKRDKEQGTKVYMVWSKTKDYFVTTKNLIIAKKESIVSAKYVVMTKNYVAAKKDSIVSTKYVISTKNYLASKKKYIISTKNYIADKKSKIKIWRRK